MSKRDALRLELLRGGVASFALKGLSTVLALSVGVVLARVLGAEGYGIYSYIFAIVSLLAVLAEFGLPPLVVRETAKADVHQNWGLMRGIWQWSTTVTCILSIGIALVAGGIAWVFRQNFSAAHVRTFVWALALVPLMSLGKLRGAALRGLRHVVLGQLPESVIRPALLIIMALSAAYLRPQANIAPYTAMLIHVVASACAFGAGAWMLWRMKPKELTKVVLPVYESMTWLRATLPLALLGGMQLVNKYTDILILGFFRPAEDVGTYQIVAQGSTLVVFGQQVSNLVLAPQFARLYSIGDRENLQRVIRMGAMVGFTTGLPVAGAFILFGKQVLTSIFGVEYADGYTALAILGTGQLVNALFGQVAHLLNMTGHERYTGRGFALAALGNVVLNFLFVPSFGINGAAFATVITYVVWNTILWRHALRVGVVEAVF